MDKFVTTGEEKNFRHYPQYLSGSATLRIILGDFDAMGRYTLTLEIGQSTASGELREMGVNTRTRRKLSASLQSLDFTSVVDLLPRQAIFFPHSSLAGSLWSY